MIRYMQVLISKTIEMFLLFIIYLFFDWFSRYPEVHAKFSELWRMFRRTMTLLSGREGQEERLNIANPHQEPVLPSLA